MSANAIKLTDFGIQDSSDEDIQKNNWLALQVAMDVAIAADLPLFVDVAYKVRIMSDSPLEIGDQTGAQRISGVYPYPRENIRSRFMEFFKPDDDLSKVQRPCLQTADRDYWCLRLIGPNAGFPAQIEINAKSPNGINLAAGMNAIIHNVSLSFNTTVVNGIYLQPKRARLLLAAAAGDIKVTLDLTDGDGREFLHYLNKLWGFYGKRMRFGAQGSHGFFEDIDIDGYDLKTKGSMTGGDVLEVFLRSPLRSDYKSGTAALIVTHQIYSSLKLINANIIGAYVGVKWNENPSSVSIYKCNFSEQGAKCVLAGADGVLAIYNSTFKTVTGKNDACLDVSPGTDLYVKDSTFDNAECGINTQYEAGRVNTAFEIEGCTFGKALGIGVMTNQPTQRMFSQNGGAASLVKDCLFQNRLSGIRVKAAGATIIGCTFENGTEPAESNNCIETHDIQIGSVSPYRSIRVIDCIFDKYKTMYAIALQAGGVEAFEIIGCTFNTRDANKNPVIRTGHPNEIRSYPNLAAHPPVEDTRGPIALPIFQDDAFVIEMAEWMIIKRPVSIDKTASLVHEPQPVGLRKASAGSGDQFKIMRFNADNLEPLQRLNGAMPVTANPILQEDVAIRSAKACNVVPTLHLLIKGCTFNFVGPNQSNIIVLRNAGSVTFEDNQYKYKVNDVTKPESKINYGPTVYCDFPQRFPLKLIINSFDKMLKDQIGSNKGESVVVIDCT